MAHYANVENGVVTSVLVVPDEHEGDGEQYLNGLGLTGRWIRTSYGTHGGVHYGPDGEPDDGVALRYNYAGIGFTYDEERDGFIPPRPEDGEWMLDDDTLLWVKVDD